MKNKNVTIRKAVAGDIDHLTNLLIELFTIETDFSIDREKHARGIALILLDANRSIIFVAEHGTSIIGMISGQLVVSTAGGGFSVLLEDMCITSAWLRLHIGTALINALETWGKEKGATRIQLVADRENYPALTFYKKQNFRQSRMTALYRDI